MSLPSGYTSLTYIKGTGTQYIDTGFKPNQNTRVTCDFDMVQNLNSKDAYIFGARIASGNTSFGFANLYNQTKWYATFANEAGNYGSGSNTGRHTVDMSQNGLIVDGSNIYTFSSDTFQSSFNLHLFAVNTNGTVDTEQIGVVKLYSCKIYDNGTLVRDFLPCKNADGTIGLWDDVNSVFYADATGGSFASGPQSGEHTAYTVTITGSGDSEKCYARINGTTYSGASTVTVNDGDEIYCYVGTSYLSTAKIKFNGTTVVSANNSEYTFTVVNDVQIALSYVRFGGISITITMSEPEDPTKPGDRHNTLNNGAACDIEGGTVLIGGTVYEIEKGEVLIGGTEYEIPFKGGKYTVTISGSPSETYAYANINGTKIYQTGEYQYNEMPTIEVYVGKEDSTCRITLNGETVKSGTGTYTLAIVAKNVAITMTKEKPYAYRADIITS